MYDKIHYKLKKKKILFKKTTTKKRRTDAEAPILCPPNVKS